MSSLQWLFVGSSLPHAFFSGKLEYQWEPLPEEVELVCYPVEEKKRNLQIEIRDKERPEYFPDGANAMTLYKDHISCEEDKLTGFEFTLKVVFPCSTDPKRLSPYYKKTRINNYYGKYTDVWNHELQHVSKWLDLVRWSREFVLQEPTCTEFTSSYSQEKEVVRIWHRTLDFYNENGGSSLNPMTDYGMVGTWVYVVTRKGRWLGGTRFVVP